MKVKITEAVKAGFTVVFTSTLDGNIECTASGNAVEGVAKGATPSEALTAAIKKAATTISKTGPDVEFVKGFVAAQSSVA